MTLFRYSRPDQTGIDRVVAGLLEFSLVNREEVGGRFRIQQVFSAPLVAFQLDDGQWVGQADVTLPVTGPTQGVRVRERLLPNVGSRTYTVVVPNPAPLYATDLVEVDPATLTPSTESVTAWEAITESIGATLTGAQSAASQAEQSAITANASAGQASDSATFAASVAVQATAAVDAVTQATADAAASATASATSATDAAASATAADASRQATEDVAAGVPGLLADVPTREEVAGTYETQAHASGTYEPAAHAAATYETQTHAAGTYATGPEFPASLPAGTALTHRYDPAHQAYNVTADTMRLWNAAKARTLSGGTPARVLCLGHSVVVGTSDSNPRWRYSFATKLRDLFNGRYGSAGTGVNYLVTTALTDDTRFVFNGTWGQALGTRGAFNAACYNATGTANTMTFTPDIPVDSFTVYYDRNTAAGTFSMSVDGGTPITVNANKTGTEAMGAATIAAGSLGTHTLTITPPASQAVYIMAVEGTVGSSGVRVSRCGRAGAFTSTITSTGTTGVDSLSTIFSSLTSPDLAVVMCEINDYNTNIPVATFTANLTTIVQRAQATGSVLVVVDETILTQPNAGGVYQSAYHAAIYGLADSLGFGVFDVASRWRDYATSVPTVPGFYANPTADPAGIHPSAVGQQDIANGLFSIAAGDHTAPAATTATASGAYLPEWQPSTAYATGQYVLNPSGQIVSANTAFTSGATYNASNWTAVSSGGGGATLPSDASISGFNAWSYDIAATAGTSTLSNQRFNVVRMVASGGTITNLHVGISTAAVTPGTGVKMGIYDASGNLLGQTADIGSNLTTSGWKTLPLAASVTVTAGQTIYVGLWWTGTTGPTVVRGSSPTTVQNAFAIGPVRFGFIAGQTSLPASFTPGSLSTETVDYWFGAS